MSGRELIRQALRARNAKVNLSTFGRDLGLNGDQIHGFIFNDADLTPEQLCAICDYLWAGHTLYLPSLDALCAAKRQEPTSMGVLPTFDIALPKYVAGAPQQVGPQPVNDSSDLKPRKRPGWISGWW